MDMSAIVESIKKLGVQDCAREHFQSSQEVWEVRAAQYQCNCSRSYLLGVLASLGETQMRQIIAEDGELKAHCHYCNTDYIFTNEDADELFSKQ